MELDMKNKELITELANRMDWTSKEVSDMLSAQFRRKFEISG